MTNDPSKDKPEADIVRFPQSRVPPPGDGKPFKQLGTTPSVKRYSSTRQVSGHWCSFCRGIWYGQLLEVACPICGNRHG